MSLSTTGSSPVSSGLGTVPRFSPRSCCRVQVMEPAEEVEEPVRREDGGQQRRSDRPSPSPVSSSVVQSRMLS